MACHKGLLNSANNLTLRVLSMYIDSSTRKVECQKVENTLTGKIIRVRRHEDRWFHHLRLKSVDEYSTPPTVEITHSAKLGEVDDEVCCSVVISGYPQRPFTSVDKETGERRQIHKVTNVLTVSDVLPVSHLTDVTAEKYG